jgi:hypothetical protein
MFEEIPEGPAQTGEVNEPAGTTAPSTQREESDPVPDLSEVDFNSLYSAIEQMANLLCDPNSLKISIQEKIRQKTLPAEWNDLVEVLPDKPLLQRVGNEWHWLFDINANPLQIPDTTPKSAAEPAAMQPAPPPQGEVAYVEALIKDVEQVNAAVRVFTEDRYTLEGLGAELRLLPISPTYNSFQLCATNYGANAGAGPTEQSYSSLSSDKSLIQEYATSVQNSLRALKRTIFLAEFLTYGRLSFPPIPGQPPPLPTSRWRSEMMRLLATDLDFARLSAPQIDSMLAEFKNEFESDERATSEEFQKIEQDTSPLDENWVSQIQGRINELFGKAEPSVAPSVASSDGQNWLDLYFLNRAKAFILHLRNKQNLKRLSLRDLRVLASWKLSFSPGPLSDVPAIHGDPDNIPLLHYAEALSATRAWAQGSSLFFALTMLLKLGFGKQVEALVFQFATELGEESAADLLEVTRSNYRTGERVFLILGGLPEQRVAVGGGDLVRSQKGEGSYAANWTLSKTHAVFPVHVSDLANVRMFPNTNQPLVVGLEISMEIQDEGLSSSVFGAQVLQGSLGSVAVGKPTNLDDAVALTKKIYPNSAPASL